MPVDDEVQVSIVDLLQSSVHIGAILLSHSTGELTDDEAYDLILDQLEGVEKPSI